MNDDKTMVTEAELHALADGLLPQQDIARVEAWIRTHPEDAARVEAWRRQNEAIRDLFAPYERTRIGDAEWVGASAGKQVQRKPGRWMAVAAGVVLVFLAGAGAGRMLPVGGEQVQEATDLHRQANSAFLVYASDVRHPVEVGADQKDHLVAWLGKRLGAKFTAPDLSGLGLSLVGGRLLPVDDQAGALLMYEEASGKRITILVGQSTAGAETSFRFAADGPVETFYWIDDALTYAVTGEISRDRLRQIADECYRQFQV